MAAVVDVDALLDGLDRMAAQRPVAARIVATSNEEDSGATELAAILGADVGLAAKVMKLANSVYFGLSGRVTSLQFAVTVVGFNTVRSIATVALCGIDETEELPDCFWDTSLHLAASAGCLGPQFRVPTADALCLGLLAQLGAALLHQADPEGYEQLALSTDLGPVRFAAEKRRFGISTPALTAEALERWHFPARMVDTLRAVPSGAEGALLRTAYEVTGRLVGPGRTRVSLAGVSDGRVKESQAPGVLASVRSDVDALRTALGL
ncbi:MAG TPA: HDOD domain-containing protein [Nocardioides sp.]|nr:HDOD domain-containing protein [Nocardioides sp.]